MVRTSRRSGRPGRLHHAAARRRIAARGPQPRKEAGLVADADVVEALPNAMFTLQLDGGHRLIGYVAGRLQHGHIRITPGDRVRVEITPYDVTRGRILYRYAIHAGAAA
jgi:translation initiation factor IF-1